MTAATPDTDLTRIVADAIGRWRYIPDAGDGQPAVRTGSDTELAQVAVDALTAAGWLQPADAPTEWSIRFSDGSVSARSYSKNAARERGALTGATVVHRRVGPWQPVDGQEANR